MAATPSRAPAVVAVLALLVAACGTDSLGGQVVARPRIVEGNALIVVQLDAGTVAGSSDVVVAADDTAVACTDGGDLDLIDVRIGSPVTFWAGINDVETSDPPILRATQVRIDCS